MLLEGSSLVCGYIPSWVVVLEFESPAGTVGSYVQPLLFSFPPSHPPQFRQTGTEAKVSPKCEAGTSDRMPITRRLRVLAPP